MVGQIDLQFFRDVQELQAEKEEIEKGDMMDGLIVGLDMLCKFVGSKKYKKRIFLITDGEKQTKFTNQEVSQIVDTIKENDVKLNCITIDFCDELAEDESDEEENEGPEDDKMKK